MIDLAKTVIIRDVSKQKRWFKQHQKWGLGLPGDTPNSKGALHGTNVPPFWDPGIPIDLKSNRGADELVNAGKPL